MRKEKAAAEKLMKQAEGSDAHENHGTKAERNNHKKVAASSETKKANAKRSGENTMRGDKTCEER